MTTELCKCTNKQLDTELLKSNSVTDKLHFKKPTFYTRCSGKWLSSQHLGGWGRKIPMSSRPVWGVTMSARSVRITKQDTVPPKKKLRKEWRDGMREEWEGWKEGGREREGKRKPFIKKSVSRTGGFNWKEVWVPVWWGNNSYWSAKQLGAHSQRNPAAPSSAEAGISGFRSLTSSHSGSPSALGSHRSQLLTEGATSVSLAEFSAWQTSIRLH